MPNNLLDFNKMINPSISCVYSHRENSNGLIWVKNVLKNISTFSRWKCFYFARL